MHERPGPSPWAAIDRYPALTDAAIAVSLAALASLWLWLQHSPDNVAGAFTVVGLGALQCLPLAWRRRSPTTVLALVTVGTICYGLAGGATTTWIANPWLLAAYSAGAFGTGPRRDRARATATALYIGYLAWEIFLGLPAENSSETGGRLVLFQLFTLVGNAAIAAGAWWFGDGTRIRREREAQLVERTRQLREEREANARRAVADERVRIARELHDVVAHHVSLMGVQAGAARRVVHQRPDQAETVLKSIEEAGRQAVRELHRLLGFLRQGEDGLAPQPTMRQIGTLIDQMREAGLPVQVTVEGDVRPLPPAIDLSAYRIVQEALTNTLKHAGPVTASVIVLYLDHALEIEVSDNGRTTPSEDRTGSGNGLLGMRERVGLVGGHFHAGPRAADGFSVRVSLPLDGSPP